MKKVVAIVLAVIIVITGVLVAVNHNRQAKEDEQIELLNNRLSQYYAWRKNIERSIDDAWEEYDEALSGGDCCFTLFVEDITPNLMENAFPTILEYGYKATVVMNNLQIPTDEGCIDKADYDKLREAGWDFAIGTGELDLSGKDSARVLANYIGDYKARLEEAQLECPKTICFKEGEYDEKYVDVLLENGFNVVRHYETFRDKFSHGVERNGLYLLSSGNVRTNTTSQLKKDMTTAYSEKYTYAVTVRYITDTDKEEDKNVDSSIVKYNAMLDFVVESCPEAKVFSATELYEYKTGAVAGTDGYVEEFNLKINGWKAEIEEINENIESLKKSFE